MKKCIIMFVFLILAIVIAKLTDTHKQVIDNNYAINNPDADMLLAKVQPKN